MQWMTFQIGCLVGGLLDKYITTNLNPCVPTRFLKNNSLRMLHALYKLSIGTSTITTQIWPIYFVCGSIWTIQVCLSSDWGTPNRLEWVPGVARPSLRRQHRSDRCLQVKNAQKCWVLTPNTKLRGLISTGGRFWRRDQVWHRIYPRYTPWTCFN